jgi:hypothetical protein
MNEKPNTISWGYFISWLILAFIGVIVSFFVFFIVMSVLGSGSSAVPSLAAILIIPVCFGSVVSLAQWFILRQYAHQSTAWIWVTLLGFLVCSPIIISDSGFFSPVVTYYLIFYMTISMGAILGVLQWIAISRKVKWSSVWVGVSLVSWFLAGLIGMGLKTLSLYSGPILFWIGFFLAGITLSALGMIWLFHLKVEPASSDAIRSYHSFGERIFRWPSSRLGWWSTALTVVFLIFLFTPRVISSVVSLGQTGISLIIMMMELCRWSAGIAGLITVMEKRDLSVTVWIAILPAVYSLVNTLYNVFHTILLK